MEKEIHLQNERLMKLDTNLEKIDSVGNRVQKYTKYFAREN